MDSDAVDLQSPSLEDNGAGDHDESNQERWHSPNAEVVSLDFLWSSTTKVLVQAPIHAMQHEISRHFLYFLVSIESNYESVITYIAAKASQIHSHQRIKDTQHQNSHDRLKQGFRHLDRVFREKKNVLE